MEIVPSLRVISIRQLRGSFGAQSVFCLFEPMAAYLSFPINSNLHNTCHKMSSLLWYALDLSNRLYL